MEEALNRLRFTIKHLEIINETLSSNSFYRETLNKLNSEFDENYLKRIYPYIDEKTDVRQMALSDMLQYMLFSRMYYDITRRRSSKTRNNSYKKFYKITLRLTNTLYLQDSILTQEEHKALRENLVDNLNEELGEDFLDKERDGPYKQVKDYIGFLHQPWGQSRSDRDNRKTTYDLLDQLLPKVRGAPNELITIIYLIRTRKGYIIPLLNYQKIIGATKNMGEEELINNLSPPDLLLLRKNKEIIGIEIGSGSSRQINSFTISTGIPVITADTNKISNHRCPYCGQWTLFCEKAIEEGMKIEYKNTNKIKCDKCDKEECKQAIVKEKIKEYYSGEAHYHLECVKKYHLNKGEEFDKYDAFSYLPFVRGLDKL